jgi:hypothetical protein
MVHESLNEESSDESIDSEINDRSFQSMSISEIDEIDQNTEKIDQNENDVENVLEEFDSEEEPEDFDLELNEEPEDSDSKLNEEEFESEINATYPNEAYGDLMSLVTKHKLSNVAGNAIIKFFNKHANLNKSPLPKSIEQGRKYMNNMNLPSLEYTKTCVINYKNNEYFLYHRSIINCIRNILSIPDISQNFALAFEKVEVIIFIIRYNLKMLDIY